jgi:hypothetical protein
MLELLGKVPLSVRILGLCAGSLLALSSNAGAGSQRCPEDSTKFARVDVSITEDGIQVSPDSQTIYVDNEPKRICWVVSNLGENRTLHIESKDAADNALGGRKIKSPKDYANSGYPGGGLHLEPGQQHSWRYKLEVTVTGETEPILSLDPEIIIVKKPTSGG